MNFQSNFDSTFYESFYSDPRPGYNHSTKSSNFILNDENEAQDFTFLPKTNSFFDNFICNPIEINQPKNDFMETAESTPPLEQRVLSPDTIKYRKYNIQNFNSNFVNLQPKAVASSPKKKFTAVLGVSTGITFSGFSKAGDSPYPQDQSPGSYTLSPGFSEDLPSSGLKDEDDDLENSEVYLNKQLTSLQECGLWSEEKDQILLKLGAQFKCDWKKITKKFGHKKITPNFLKTRFKELTCAPLQRRVKFSHAEDLMIAKYFEKYGSHWGQMATHFKNRSPIMLKNRYYSFIRKRNLLNVLLKKVREIEGNSGEIDDFKEDDLEKRFEGLNVQRNATANSASDGMYFEAEQSSEFYEASPTLSYYNESRSPLFESDVNHRENVSTPEAATYTAPQDEMKCLKLINLTPVETPNVQEDPKTKEIETLKSQVRSLQALYLKTRLELDKFKVKAESQL